MKKTMVLLLILSLALFFGCGKSKGNPGSTAEDASLTALLKNAVPVYTDDFKNKNDVESVSSPFYKQTVPSVRNISYTGGKNGKGVRLKGYDSYYAYPEGLLNAAEGTIRFWFKPDKDIYKSYNTRQKDWLDYSSYKPPFSGFLVDTVGWNPAFPGGYGVFINFAEKDKSYSSISFGTWSGGSWSYATGEMPEGFSWKNKWYDIVVSYSSSRSKIRIYVDSVLIAEASYNTAVSTSEPFFLGQAPWMAGSMEYWPYGPHAMKGTYSYLRIYDIALME